MRRFLLIAALAAFLPAAAHADSDVPTLTAGTSLTSAAMYLANAGATNNKLGLTTSVFDISAGALTLKAGGVSDAMLASTFLKTSALGTNVGTALGIAVGSAGAFLKNNGDALSGTYSGNPTFSGIPLFTGLADGTQVSCLGLDGSNNLVTNPVACGSGSGGGVTSVSGSGGVTVSPTTGDVLVSLTNQCPIGIDTWDGTSAKTVGATTGLLYTTGSAPIAAARVLSLPTVASYTLGCALTVVDLAAIFNATNLVTPTRQSSDTIDGATTGTTLGAARQSVTYVPTVAGKWATVAPPTLASDVAVTNQFVTAIPDTGRVTRAQPAASDLSNGVTGSGAVVLAAGGALTGVTGLGIRDTSAAFDVTIAATSSTTISAGRILTIDVQNAAQTIKLGTAGTKTFPDGSKTLLANDWSNVGATVLPVANIGGSAASHSVPVDVGGTSTYKAIPDCTDTTGNHLNFTQSTDAFSCGSTVPTTVALLGASQSFTKGQAVTPVALTDGATPAVDASLGNDFTLTMVHTTSARTIQNPSNLKAGQTLNFYILQDGTGGATYAFGSQYKFSGATAPTATAAASAKDVISCRSDTTTSMMCSPSYDFR